MNDNNTQLRLAGVIRESIVDGPGIRMVVFAQGCPHKCPGCHNIDTHDLNGGYISSVDSIMKEAKKNSLLKGLTLSGGEPFLQAKALSELAKQAHSEGLDIITYSGFTFEELLANPTVFYDLLKETEILVDGKFMLSQKNLMLKFRGSQNQRVIDVKASLASGSVVLIDW